MRQFIWIAILLSTPAVGQVRPVPSDADPMSHIVAYAEDQTVILEAAPGFQVTVELDRGEPIQSAAAGDATYWQVSAPRGSSQFFVRPNPGAQSTNLSVVTKSRIYHFLLIPAQQMTAGGALSVRFTYPDVAAPRHDAALVSAPVGIYSVSGAVSISPSRVWDDGQKTFLDWPQGIEAPAIFAIDGAGRESLVNCQFRDGRFVIDAVYSRLVFRLDRLIAKADRKRGKQS